MKETCLHLWWFTGTLCDAYTQWPTPADRIKLGVAQARRRGSSWALHAVCCLLSFARLISLARSLTSFAIFACPTLPWVGLRVWLWVCKYSTESFSVTVPRWVVATSGLPWIPPSLLYVPQLYQSRGTSAQAHLLMMNLTGEWSFSITKTCKDTYGV